MKELWKRIEEWLRANAPDILADLQPPATSEERSRAEETFGVDLPEDVIASYDVHNGTRGSAPPLFGDWRLLSLDASTKEWNTIKVVADEGTFEGMETDPDPQVGDAWWLPAWIPVASNDSGDFLCVDMDPAPGGTNGQLISYLHADAPRALVAPSFETYLRSFADDLEAGRYTVVDGRIKQQA
jgi:cell wall assembly regulator SMI1